MGLLCLLLVLGIGGVFVSNLDYSGTKLQTIRSSSESNFSVLCQLSPLLSSQNSGGPTLVTEQKYLLEQWKVSSHKIKIDPGSSNRSLCNYLNFNLLSPGCPTVQWLIFFQLNPSEYPPPASPWWTGLNKVCFNVCVSMISHCALIYTHIVWVHLAPRV